jgi:NADP-dependent 3-hydroxy acid dehydrogenase YdfG
MKTALITGTSSGLGECLALALLKSGWKVIGLSRRENKQLDRKSVV